MAQHRFIPEWMQARSEAAQRGWHSRWERAWEIGDFDKLGPKGQRYIESHYGTVVKTEGYPEDYYDEFEDPYDYEIEY